MRLKNIFKLVLGIIAFGLFASALFIDTLWAFFMIMGGISLGIVTIIDALTDREPKIQQQPFTVQQPQPAPVEEVKQFIFRCKHCEKEFNDEKKLRRHVGMAHYDKLEI